MIVMSAGMSRSGSTLQYQLIKTLVEWNDIGEGRGVWNTNKPMDWHSNLIYVYKSERFIPRRYISKIYHSFSIVRNPFDVAVSLYRYRVAKEYYSCKGKLFSMNEIIRSEMVNVIEWIEAWEKLGAHTIRYEDVFPDNCSKVVEQAADVLRIEHSMNEINKIVGQYTIKKNMDTIGSNKSWFDYTRSMLTLAHIGPNMGEPGQGDLFLNQEQKDMILTYAGDFMERHEYI